MAADERNKLKVLLGHWIEHNREHSEEFQDWAERAKAFGEADIGEDISGAARELDKANECLSRALKRLA